MKTKNIQHSSKTKKFPIFGILKQKVKKNTHTKEKRKKKVSHRQKPENTIHNEDKNRSIETDSKMTQMTELVVYER